VGAPPTSHLVRAFNSFEDETVLFVLPGNQHRTSSFNSFEDETIMYFKAITFFSKVLYLSILLRMKRVPCVCNTQHTHNLSIPLRMKRGGHTARLRCTDILSIPLRMKLHLTRITLPLVVSFNSFEDETFLWQACVTHTQTLSIPLRMKPFSGRKMTGQTDIFFQFLWGWNKDEKTQTQQVQTQPTFNSFEDETQAIPWALSPLSHRLSIPLRMKLKFFSLSSPQKHLSIPLRMKHEKAVYQ